MQTMQDNEFDKFFKQQFENTEMAPPAGMWSKIEGDLQPAKKKPVKWLWTAASVAAVALTFALALQKPDKIYLHGPALMANKVTHPVGSAQTSMAIVSNPDVGEQPAELPQSTVDEPVVKNKAVENQGVVSLVKNNSPALQPNPEPVRLPIKQTDAKPIEVGVIDEQPMVEHNVVFAMAQTNNVVNDLVIGDEPAVATERKSIEGVGDLLNYVVDKIDKRNKKLIEFNSDEEGTSLVGVNIGFIKWNRKNR